MTEDIITTKFEKDCALMAGSAYRRSRPDEKNQFPVPDGWTDIGKHIFDDSTGFEAVTFRRDNEIVISYAGTYDKDITGDWFADLCMGTGFGSIQLMQAAAYYMQIKAAYSDPKYKITFTGHSLGGGLAALMGVFFDKETITFDQAPFRLSATDGVRDWIKNYLLGLRIGSDQAN